MTEHYINISDEAAVNYANSFADADGAELRRRLRSLAMSLPIDDVRRILDIIDGEAGMIPESEPSGRCG